MTYKNDGVFLDKDYSDEINFSEAEEKFLDVVWECRSMDLICKMIFSQQKWIPPYLINKVEVELHIQFYDLFQLEHIAVKLFIVLAFFHVVATHSFLATNQSFHIQSIVNNNYGRKHREYELISSKDQENK
jgi:hypothetical protein